MSLRVVALLGLFLGSLVTSVLTADQNWWRHAIVYQVYPRSYKDSNGDGVGDLKGILSKLDHIKDTGAAAFWISPINRSPMVDFGYDVSNFTDIDPIYGTLADFEDLIAQANSVGLKIILDFVPNHSSTQHEWFQKSVKRIKPYDEYYVWKDAKVVDGKRYPPNNWLSIFSGTAWEWNEERQQYYLHQFGPTQADLNYRSSYLNQEMKNALQFWLERGIGGFRIDAANFMFEDSQFLDEPPSNITGLTPGDSDSLDHIYTQNLQQTYEVIKSWRELLNEYAKEHDTDLKLMLTEVYAPINDVTKYYRYGVNVPFNFMFVTGLNNQSTAADFKKSIDTWIDNIPSGDYMPNWVVGNHDNPRAATRFGTLRADQTSILAMTLPGVAVVYNGDEIGMEDTDVSWEDTVDPSGLSAGPIQYKIKSRDPERTPFQWDDTKDAGFSTASKTWLPINPNYKTLNLAAEEKAPVSHYSVFKDLVKLRKLPVLQNGSLENVLVTDSVLGIVRRLKDSPPVVILVNFSDSPTVVDAQSKLEIPQELSVYTASVYSKIQAGSPVDTSKLSLPGAASVVLSTPELIKEVQTLS
ncbi:maltase 2 [Orussus abietinus]|uniref:maltase 2 n=1 Tax=Orussus abietinus TaxID=222816 RepID=UPI000626C592|nr:maltase 2 [Orussus abietinus]